MANFNNLLLLITKYQPETICLQETKCLKFPEIDGYFCFGSAFPRSQHHGVAIYTKVESRQIPLLEELRGHAIAIMQGETLIVNVYVKNSGQSLDARKIFDSLLWGEIARISTKSMIIAGDFNVCVDLDDHHLGKINEKQAGLESYCKDFIAEMISKYNLLDTYKICNYEEHGKKYKWTFKTRRYGNKEDVADVIEQGRNNGLWRLDYIFTTHEIFNSSATLLDIRGSDHVPVMAH